MQVITGPVADADALTSAVQRWVDEVSPGATGWLGSTVGVTDEGIGVLTARFADEQAARRNSDRPEQGEWWAEASKAFAGTVEFLDCDVVQTMRAGGSDEAGFVQLILGRVSDAQRAQELQDQADYTGDWRPDVIGGIVGLAADGRFANIVYFTSEPEARAGESAGPPPEMQAIQSEMQSLMSDMTFHDLRHPVMFSPKG
jgi:hypothetical protein